MEDKKILVVGTFDSKLEEYQFLISEIERMNGGVLALDIGTYSKGVELDVESISSEEVLTAAGTSLELIRSENDRGQAMKMMSQGAATLAKQLFESGRISGVVGMGGSGGSSVISAAMRSLPIGVPKVLLSTMVGENTGAYVGCKDIVMIPSITDISGLNRITRKMISSTAAAITGMTREYRPEELEDDGTDVIAISMFGNTTACVDRCRQRLEGEGREVIVFHSTGTGGRTMESLIDDGFVDGCLDITTTEIADEVCGGILSAGPDRLAAPGRMGIPHLVVPGCVDMVNFGSIDSVPVKYREANRLFYEWNPSVTLMRTNVAENIEMGQVFVKHLNRATGPVEVLIPLKGVSILDGDGELFCDREADQALFDTLKSGLSNQIKITEVDCAINDPEFADLAVNIFEQMLQSTGNRT